MIKVGDYAKYKNDILIVKKTYMYSFVGISLTHATEHVLDYDNDVSWLVDYEDYEQQKQRADELEKRWEKLKEHFNKAKEQSLGILSWSRNNGILELMHDLEEDGE